MAVPYPLSDYSATVEPGQFPGGTAPENRYKEWFSWAVVSGVVSAAGLVCQVPIIDVNKVDVTVETWGVYEGRMRTIGLQLKATSSPSFIGPDDDRKLSFSLIGDDYNELAGPGNVPRFLVVVALPTLESCWVEARHSTVGLCAGAWWTRVEGEETDQATKTVHLPVEQRFDVAALETMLKAA